jgi:hypothetical protein
LSAQGEHAATSASTSGRQRDAFEGFRDDLELQLTANRDLGLFELRAAIVLARHINRKKWLAEKIAEAWPGEVTLAILSAHVGADGKPDRRNLKRSINALQQKIGLEVIPGKRGRGNTTRYRFPAQPQLRNAAEYRAYVKAWILKAMGQAEAEDDDEANDTVNTSPETHDC